MFNANKSTVVEVPGVKQSLDKIVGLPNFPTQSYNFLMRFLLSSSEKLDPFIVALF